MPSPDYSAAVFPDRFRVCGVWLKPMTLGHALLLRRLGNPFVTGDGIAVTRAHVLQCAIVLSREWKDAESIVNSKRASWFYRFRTMASDASRAKDVVTLSMYFEASFPKVDYWREEDGRDSGFDGIDSLFISQRIKCGLSVRDALSVPVAVAVLDRYYMAEESGRISVWSTTDRLLAERARHG
jgi:hypothetical protein